MKKVILFTPLLALTACVSTAYGPKTAFSAGGYEDGKLSENQYWLRYTGASNLSKVEEIKALWERRAKELCQNKTAKMELEDSRIWGSKPQSTFVKGKVTCVEK